MPIPDSLSLRYIETTADIEDFLRWLSEDAQREYLGFDTETSGFSPERERVRLMQFGDERMGWAFDWEEWRGLARQVFKDYTGQFVGHNVKFDIRHISAAFGWRVQDWPWHRTHDTMAMAHIADSQARKDLKGLSDKLVDPRASQGQKALDAGFKANGWDWGTVPTNFPPYWQYGALDPVLTVLIAKQLKGHAPPDLYDLEMGAIRVAAKMEQTGVRISRAYAVQKATELDEYVRQAKQWLGDVHGLERPTPMQLLKFFKEHNVPMLEKHTSGGAQSMDKEVLNSIDHPVAKTVLAIRKAEKLSGTYLWNLARLADESEFLHPSINTMAARTGRMSITEPALQTLPARDPTVRDAFIPRDDHSLLTIDANQIEARLTAHFSGDQGLIEAFLSPEDFFCRIASDMYKREIKKGMRERDNTKSMVYGLVYGASVAKMAETAGVPAQEMHVTNALFNDRFPGVRKFMTSVVQEGQRRKATAEDGRGYVVTPYGRVLKADRGKEYALVNYLIQCHASEILKKKLVMLDNVLPDEVKILLPIHDEIIFDVPNDIKYEVKQLAEDTLNESEGYRVPITWDGDLLDGAWGSKYH